MENIKDFFPLKILRISSHPLPLKAVSKTHFWSILLTAFGGRGEGGKPADGARGCGLGLGARAGGSGMASFQL